jgi:hypothetical protein
MYLTGAIVALTVLAGLFYITDLAWFAINAGVGAIAALGLLAFFMAGLRNPLEGITGLDGRGSTSKFQAFFWFLAVFFAYAMLFAARMRYNALSNGADLSQALNEIPGNLLIAMGFSVATYATAKGITTTYVAAGKVIKPARADQETPGGGQATERTASETPETPTTPTTPTTPDTTDSGPVSGIVLEDDGKVGLSKVQLLGWTFLSIAIFLVTVIQNLQSAAIGLLTNPNPPAGSDAYNNLLALLSLPDIDQSLMVLMGLGAGAYLGNKLVSSDQPRLTGISPSGGPPGTEITLYGTALTAGKWGGQITIDKAPSPEAAQSAMGQWEDDNVVFTLPQQHPNSAILRNGAKIDIGLIVGGKAVQPALPFTVTTPIITDVKSLEDGSIQVLGHFGKQALSSRVLVGVGNQPAVVTEWKPDSITFTPPAASATVAGQPSAPIPFTIEAGGLFHQSYFTLPPKP